MKDHFLLGLLAAGGTAVVAYYAARFMKGSVNLKFERRRYKAGDSIQGTVSLRCRQEVECNRFYVALVCTEVTKKSTNSGTDTHTREVFRRSQELAGRVKFPAGTDETHEFKLEVPESVGLVRGATPAIDAAISIVAFLVRDGTSTKEWTLETRVDATGVDLLDTKKVSVLV